ncbi:7814_t:CDS:2 [Cetraspora pellucida]|uniref:7814_t:CDS:1 n=1 Tax=Cetraspora pellucida TaxID=1433469 RepID=A0ACA9LP28_9GLOM|nr:7814_t:CDS:2 [Cetraspora pellucida]
MTSSIDVIQYPGNGIHAEEIDVENKSTSSGLSDHPRDKNYVSSSLSGSVTIVEEEKDKSKRKKSKSRGFRHILKREEKDNVTEKPDSKQRSNEEKKSESLARTLSGMFSHKSKSEKEKRKEVVDNKNRIIPKQTNDGSETKSKNRRSLIFFSDNEDEATDHAKRSKRLNSNDSPFSDNESSSNKLKNVRKNRISLNIDKLLGLDDDHKHKNFNNNNITDLFLPETNGSPIKTYKGRLDSSNSVGGRDSPVSILKRAVAVPNQTESPISHTTTFAPSVSIINESTPDYSQETKIESVESVEQKDEIKVESVESVEQKDEIKVESVEQKDEIKVEAVELKNEINIELIEQNDETNIEPVEQKDETKTEPVEQKDEIKIEPVEQKEINIEPVEQNDDFKIDPVEQNEEFKDDLDYSSTPPTSINEDLPINEQELKLVSQVSSDSLNAEVSRESSYYQVNKDICNNTDIEISNDIKDPIDDEIINDNLKVEGYTNLALHDSDQGAKSIETTANSHEDEHLSSTYSSGSSVASDFLISNIYTDSEIQKSLNHDVEHNYLEEDDVKYEQVYHIENKILKTSPIISLIPQISEKQVIITQENQKLEELQAANESLNNAKIQLESMIQEQSQQIAKLTSLESINESLVNAKNQLESKVQEQSEQIAKLTFVSANEPLNNDKDQLESKVQEQSQQIAKLTSLESVMVRQFELAERMEETMRRLEAKVNNQKEELDGLLAGRMEDTIRQLEYKLNEQNKEVEGLKSVVGELCSKNSPSTNIDSGRAAQLSVTSSPEERTLIQTSSPSMMTASITMTEQQAYTKDTLVNTLVVKPLVNTITVSASIATSVLYAVYVRPVVGLVKVVRHGL